MEQAAFESPLSDDELRELGRLVINCGFVEFLVGFHVSMLLNIGTSARARMELVAPLATRRKIDIVKRGLATIPKSETRALVGDACKLMDPTIRERNILLHGIWGRDSKDLDRAVVVSTKETSGHLRPADITKNADALAAASRHLLNAMMVDRVGEIVEKIEPLAIDLNE
jgi:hypothetical protein